MQRKRALRAYFETYGTFNGVSKNPIISSIKNNQCDAYLSDTKSLIGFTEEEYCNIKPKEYNLPNKDLVIILANYLKNTDAVLNLDGKNNTTLRYVLSIAAITLQKDKYKEITQDKNFLKCLKSILPKWVQVDNCQPMISCGRFVHPNKLTTKEKSLIIYHAIQQVTFDVTKIPLDVRLHVLNSFKEPSFSLVEHHPKIYFDLIKIAREYNISFRELIEACNLNYISALDQLNEYECTVSLADRYSVNVLTDKSNNILTFSVDQFRLLYEHDLLQTLVFDGEDPYLFTPLKQSVGAYFGVLSKHDFRQKVSRS